MGWPRGHSNAAEVISAGSEYMAKYLVTFQAEIEYEVDVDDDELVDEDDPKEKEEMIRKIAEDRFNNEGVDIIHNLDWRIIMVDKQESDEKEQDNDA